MPITLGQRNGQTVALASFGAGRTAKRRDGLLMVRAGENEAVCARHFPFDDGAQAPAQ